MFHSIPAFAEPLSEDHVHFLKQMSASCRRSIIEMIAKAASGHTGGSLSMIDFLTLIYAFRLSQTGEKIVISNGHTAPALYAILAEMGYADKDDVLNNFRQIGTVYEGHVNRHMPGVWYGTGPLGCGISAAVGFAHANKLKGITNEKVFCAIGDGELNEGQTYEAAMYARKFRLDNLIVFVDYNKVQLMGSLEEIMPVDLHALYASLGWEVLETNGHDFTDMWQTFDEAESVKDKPVLILGKTIMGKGVSFIEEAGRKWQSKWHGKSVTLEEMVQANKELIMEEDYEWKLGEFKKFIKWQPQKPAFTPNLSPVEIKTGTPKVYDVPYFAPRTAFGETLLDIAKQNPSVYGMSCDVGISVRTDILQNNLPAQFLECGIQEQNMVTVAGAMSLCGLPVFTAAYGPFMTSRPKDQARLNDINHTNVKMIGTHSGLSVGEDGPTHQSIDDMGAFLGHFNTHIIEAIDANHMDRVIRYAASHYGNFYIRTGRHDALILRKKDGSVFYDEHYIFEYGKTDIVREGSEVTIVASGPMVAYAAQAADDMKGQIEVIAVSCIRELDKEKILASVKKTGRLITVEDHNPYNGLASQVGMMLALEDIALPFMPLGITKYNLSGKYFDLYRNVGLDTDGIKKAVEEILKDTKVVELEGMEELEEMEEIARG